MLVLSRKKYEAIIFTTELGEVKVQVVDVKGDVVRLGIECDKKIPVHREEVFDAIKMEAKQREGIVKYLCEYAYICVHF